MVGDGRGEHEVEGDTNCDGEDDGMAISIKNVVIHCCQWGLISKLIFRLFKVKILIFKI